MVVSETTGQNPSTTLSSIDRTRMVVSQSGGLPIACIEAATSPSPAACMMTLHGNTVPDLILDVKRLICHARVAGADDSVGTEFHADFLLQRLLDVDFSDHAKTGSLQGACRSLYRFVKAARQRFSK